MFLHLRDLTGVKYNEFSEAYGTNVISRALTCIWCFSFWVGLGLVLAYAAYPKQTVLASLPFALSAGAILVNRWTL